MFDEFSQNKICCLLFHKLSTSLLFVDKENLQSQEMENYAHYKEMKTRPKYSGNFYADDIEPVWCVRCFDFKFYFEFEF